MTHAQAQQLHDAILPSLGYLAKLMARIDQKRFPADDKLRRFTLADESLNG